MIQGSFSFKTPCFFLFFPHAIGSRPDNENLLPQYFRGSPCFHFQEVILVPTIDLPPNVMYAPFKIEEIQA